MTLVEVLERLMRSELKCLNCGRRIPQKEVVIGMYPHDGGTLLREGLEYRFWVYVECLRCGYQNSLQALMRGEVVR